MVMDKQSRAGVFTANILVLAIAICLVYGLTPGSVKGESSVT